MVKLYSTVFGYCLASFLSAAVSPWTVAIPASLSWVERWRGLRPADGAFFSAS
jgi:hypothetical protein